MADGVFGRVLDPRTPLVADLGQDAGTKNPPDALLNVHAGDNYRFPKCNWTSAAPCTGVPTPRRFFAPHTDVGGVAIVDRTVYLSEFGMGGHPPAIASTPLSSGAVKPYVTV